MAIALLISIGIGFVICLFLDLKNYIKRKLKK